MGRRDSEAPAPMVASGRHPHEYSGPASSVVMVLGRAPNGVGGGGGGGSAPGASGGESSFDINVVIILGALFIALLFAIGLNSVAQCALRYGRGVESSGIKRRALRSIPVEVYGVGEDAIDDVCAICLGEFVDGEKLRVLPRCGHGFHVLCVDAWLVSRGSCPTCRCLVMDIDGDLHPGDSSHTTIAVVIT